VKDAGRGFPAAARLPDRIPTATKRPTPQEVYVRAADLGYREVSHGDRGAVCLTDRFISYGGPRRIA
jgi:hypothetical protein